MDRALPSVLSQSYKNLEYMIIALCAWVGITLSIVVLRKLHNKILRAREIARHRELLNLICRPVETPRVVVADVLAGFEDMIPPQDGLCGVCYESMNEGELLGCPECNRPAHKGCLKEWIESGQTVCIYCRHNLAPA